MLCGNGWSLCGRYRAWDMDALWEGMESVWTLSWLGHGCGNGWRLCGYCESWDMDALWEGIYITKVLSCGVRAEFSP